MAKVKSDGHIWGLDINRYVCFLFRGHFFIDLEIQGQSHDENRPKSNQVIYRSGSLILPRMKKIQKCVQKLSREQKCAVGGGAGGGVRTGTKT